MESHRTHHSPETALPWLQAISGQEHPGDDARGTTVARAFPAGRAISDRGETVFVGRQLLSERRNRVLPITLGDGATRKPRPTAAWLETSDQSKHEEYVMRHYANSWGRYEGAATVAWL